MLLFQILMKKPELTGVVFKNHPSWDPKRYTLVNCITHGQSTVITLGSQDLLAALESALQIADYHFFLLIDGLDDMKTTIELDRKNVAEKILHWSTNSWGRVKICVSSRSNTEFIETFPVQHRLQLDSVNEPDIKAFVHLKLKKKSEYLGSEKRPILVSAICDEANGIFLWASLALEHIRPLLVLNKAWSGGYAS
jgi:hypothetical protein